MITLATMCLGLAIYFEARGESVLAQEAVAAVILNRVDDSRWPDTVCDVIYQPHQFSFLWDGKSDRPLDEQAWNTALQIATAMIQEWGWIDVDPTQGATHYHTLQVQPYWSDGRKPTVTIGNHHFYRL